MRILVFSDSHGAYYNIINAIEAQTSITDIIFLGDGARDIEQVQNLYPSIHFHCVCGNCDLCTDLPTEKTVILGGKKIFVTHGHLYGVKYGYGRLIKKAADTGADVLLFGHTHHAEEFYENGIYIMNPGSISSGYVNKTYGCIDIKDGQILTHIAH